MATPNTQASSPAFFRALSDFAAAIAAKASSVVRGAPEDRLRAPLEQFCREAGAALGIGVRAIGEARIPGLGRPDYAVERDGLLAGYIELKPTGTGAAANRFRGHDRKQFQRFAAIPNLLYADGAEWALYRSGERVGRLVRLAGDPATEGRKAVSQRNARALEALLRDFLNWEPTLPLDVSGAPDFERLAAHLAPLCRMLRDEVADSLSESESPLRTLAEDWRQLLFPEADDRQFADAYAQTVTFALLLGRTEGADPLTLRGAQGALDAEHTLLSKALEILTVPEAQGRLAAPLKLLIRVVGAVPHGRFVGEADPWLYFYEDFLAAYDPRLRKNAGAYFTPAPVVRAQTRLVDDILANRLGKRLGFAHPEVVTLDPALGTGTYLLAVMERALERVRDEEGPGAIAGQATALAENLYGFELMVGPYAVAELRISGALRAHGAELPEGGVRIYLTDTLDNPNAEPPNLPLVFRPVAEQRAKALRVKRKVPVLVAIGNPPYDRHEAADETNRARTGGFVRWGAEGTGRNALLRDFTEPVKAVGKGGQLKNLYNLYVYFWRWALWKVFEQSAADAPGVVSFITASSFLDGDAFLGMRNHLRRVADEIRVLDLGGDGRGTDREQNVFDIQTPVAITVAVRYGNRDPEQPASVHYARLRGDRKEKYEQLEEISGLAGIEWSECPGGDNDPFRFVASGTFFGYPLLTDLLPWQQSGVKAGRTWAIAPSQDVLAECWGTLLDADPADRARLFKNSPTGRKVHETATQLPPSSDSLEPISSMTAGKPVPKVSRYSYRSFDRQFILADARVLDRPSPRLWTAHGDRQVYLTTLFSQPLSSGPALTAAAQLPDLHHFRGSYGSKTVIPLFRDSEASEPNLTPGLLSALSEALATTVVPEDFAAYLYGTLAHRGFTVRFARELVSRELRVPITKDPDLFQQMRALGARLLWLHTYGERCAPLDVPIRIPSGKARCVVAVPGTPDGYPGSFRYDDGTQTLRVGRGEFGPVAPKVWDFEVSGLRVVRSWLGYRMRHRAGKKSSPLDEIRPECWPSAFTTELLQLLWVLETTLEAGPEQEQLLAEIVAGDCFHADELPSVPEAARQAPPLSQPVERFPKAPGESV